MIELLRYTWPYTRIVFCDGYWAALAGRDGVGVILAAGDVGMMQPHSAVIRIRIRIRIISGIRLFILISYYKYTEAWPGQFNIRESIRV